MDNNSQDNRMTENKPRRVPVGGMRDILTVYGKDPSKKYRFVKDKDENGMRMQTFIRGGWTFTDPKAAGITVGEENVHKSKKGTGSVVRYPAGEGEWLYLMEISKELWEEDRAADAARIDEGESSITGTKSSDDNELGQYGQVKIGTKTGR